MTNPLMITTVGKTGRIHKHYRWHWLDVFTGRALEMKKLEIRDMLKELVSNELRKELPEADEALINAMSEMSVILLLR